MIPPGFSHNNSIAGYSDSSTDHDVLLFPFSDEEEIVIRERVGHSPHPNVYDNARVGSKGKGNSPLPVEILLQIFRLLDYLALLRVSSINRLWYRVAQDQKLWKSLCLTHSILPHSTASESHALKVTQEESSRAHNYTIHLMTLNYWKALFCTHMHKRLKLWDSWHLKGSDDDLLLERLKLEKESPIHWDADSNFGDTSVCLQCLHERHAASLLEDTIISSFTPTTGESVRHRMSGLVLTVDPRGIDINLSSTTARRIRTASFSTTSSFVSAESFSFGSPVDGKSWSPSLLSQQQRQHSPQLGSSPFHSHAGPGSARHSRPSLTVTEFRSPTLPVSSRGPPMNINLSPTTPNLLAFQRRPTTDSSISPSPLSTSPLRLPNYLQHTMSTGCELAGSLKDFTAAHQTRGSASHPPPPPSSSSTLPSFSSTSLTNASDDISLSSSSSSSTLSLARMGAGFAMD